MDNILRIPVPLRLRCSSCGATQLAACECGVAYMPAGELAAKAAAENPSISARALASQLGVSKDTINRTRERGGANASSDAVVGRDGKLYSEKVKPRRDPPADVSPTRVEETWATAAREDFAAPDEADRAIVLLADRVNDPLFLPPPGILACCREAFARASLKHRKAIEEAAYTLSELVKK